MERLSNERWGFRSNCYVCEPTNARGMQMPFFHDTDAGVVFADLDLSEDFSGAPSYVHGGVTLALMDEAMAWAAIAVGGKFAVTQETSATFDWPVRVGRQYRLEARLTERTEQAMAAEAVVRDAQGRACVTGRCTLVVLGAARARDAIGSDPEGDDAGFVR
ncbi:MAG: PaaI family thioesterase [Acidimicrobiia bacterium]